MDPDKTLLNLLLSIAHGDPDAAAEDARHLAEWIDRDGFAPEALADCIERAQRARRTA